MKYYIDIENKTAGPFTLNQVKALYENGKIEDTFLYVSDEGGKEWMPLSFLIPLFSVTEQTQDKPQVIQQPSVIVNNNVMSNNQGVSGFGVINTPHKSRTSYMLLAIFLGSLGIHNFYIGRNVSGVIQLLITLLSLGMLGFVSWFIALVEIFTVKTDGNNMPLI